MRVLRTILGMLLLTIGLPSLLAGAGLWAAMQHRDQGGAFSGDLQRLITPGYALVVPDVDHLLRSDAPFTRLTHTQLRITVRSQDGPAFVGIAPTAAVDEYLYGVPHSTVESVDIGTGALPVATRIVGGRQAPAEIPARASFWLRTGDGALAWSPGEVTGGPYSLVVMSPGAKPGLQLTTTAELRPGWLDSGTWGLLTLGTLLVMGGLIVLAWPARRREVVYVVEPSQVPDLMAAIGAPLPLSLGSSSSTDRGAGAHRPRTLAEAQRAGALPSGALQFTWPPVGSPALAGPEAVAMRGAPSAAEYAAATAIPGSSAPQVIAGHLVDSEAGCVAASAVSGGSAFSDASAVSGGSVVTPAPVAPAPVSPSSTSSVAVSTGSALNGSSASLSSVSLSSVSPAPVSPASGSPAPGEPLSFIRPKSAGGPVSLPLGDPPSAPDPLFGRRSERGRRNPSTPADLPMFHASAVDAWVAETAAERARETEAAAAARLAEVARRKASTEEEPTSPSSPESRRTGPRPGVDRPGSGGGRVPSGDRAVAAAYEAGAADARAARGDFTPASPAERETVAASTAGRESMMASAGRDPRAAAQRVSVITGPNATDWAATGLTRADSRRVGRQPSPGVGQGSPSRVPVPAAGPTSKTSTAPTSTAPTSTAPTSTAPTSTAPAAAASTGIKPAQNKPVAAKTVQGGGTTTADPRASAKAGPTSVPTRAEGERPTPFPKVFGLGRPSVAAAERAAGDAELGRAMVSAGPAGATVQREEFSVSSEGVGSLQRATPGAPAESSNSATTASAGAEPPLTASRARQAAGADTGTGHHDRTPVSAPQPNSIIASSGAAPDEPDRPAEPKGAPHRPSPRQSPAGSPAPDRAATSPAPGRAATPPAPDRAATPPTADRAATSPALGRAATPPAPGRTAAPTQPADQDRAPTDGSAPASARTTDSAAAGVGRTSDAARADKTPGGPADVPAGETGAARAANGGPEVSAVMHAMARGERIAGPGAVPPAANGSVAAEFTPDGPPEVLPNTRPTQPEEGIGVAGRLPGLGGRPTPAAWRRAAESVAARAAAAQAQPEPAADVADPPAEPGAKPAKTTRARATKATKAAAPKKAAATKASPTTASPAKASSTTAASAKTTPAKAAPAKATSTAAKATPAATKSTAADKPAVTRSTSTTAAKSATRAAASSASRVTPAAASETTAAGSGNATPGVAAPATSANPGHPVSAAAGRMSDYQREAAELLAASALRRRRRTVTNPAAIEPASPEPVRRRRAAPTPPEDD
ncbi:hypothetical protein [Actinoplanes subtropicus]|uniref:hypothetical protein n=1 Tax=Actinoplanes subtropicus TaxID=543632 RepID=UPI0006898A6A|nr:hypothetical protein [Actinoplanes subtropicus]